MSRIIGAPVDRVEGAAKVTGQARYAADQQVPGLTHGVLVTSRIARGRVTAIDTSAAEAAPGVLAVVTHQDPPRFAHTPSAQPWPFGQSFVPLQDGVVHTAGQIVAFVVAESLEQARFAAGLVVVDYAEERPAVSLADNLDDAFVPETPPGSPLRYEHVRGDPEAALADAAVRVEGTFTTSMQHHNPMEPSATTAVWDGDHLTLYETTQGLALTQPNVATMLGIPPENVRVITPYLGGGFGCKGYVWPHTFLTAAVARRVGRPVKLVLTRAQEYTLHGHRAETIQHLRVGAERRGRLTAIVHTAVHQTSPYDDISWEEIDASNDLYACANVALTRRVVRLNLGTPTPMRAPAGVGGFALEAILDELSHVTGIDPVELRLRNYSERDPETGEPWGTGKFLRECYTIGADLFDWPRRRPRPRSVRRDGHLVGWGMATAFHNVYRSPAEATVHIGTDGRAVVRSGTQDIGTGTYTVVTQVTADTLGMLGTSVRYEFGDTRLPPGAPSVGSRTAVSVGGAAHNAAVAARDEVIAIAVADPRSPLHGVPAAHVAAGDGRLFNRHDPRQGETYAQVLGRNDRTVDTTGNTTETARHHSYGAVFAEVRVNETTGETRVSRLAGAFDAGRILNPKTAASQATGGMIWGLGTALTEHTIVDVALGRILTANLSGYLVPVSADVPATEVAFVNKPDPAAGVLGARGNGELSPNGTTAAIANAIFHATGRRVRELPITPDKLL